jgi:hypothetical protein
MNRKPFHNSIRWRAAALCAITVLACEDGLAPSIEPAASVEIVSGDAQTGAAGTELSEALVARVLDRNGRPTLGQAVAFRVVSGGGAVFAGTSNSNREGIVSERWTVGTTAGVEQRVELRSVDNTTGEAVVLGSFTANVVAGPATNIMGVSGVTSGPVNGRTTEPLTVRITDQFGNAVQGAVVQWTLVSGAGTLEQTQSTTDADGQASSWLTFTAQSGARTVAATHGSLSVQLTAVATPGTPASLEIGAGDLQTAVVGSSPAINPRVRVLDALGNPVFNATVTFSVTSGGGQLSNGTTRVTATDGTAEHNGWTLGNIAGTNTLRAAHGTLPPVTFTASGVAGTATSAVRHAGNNQGAPPGSTLPVSPAVLVRDVHGNPVAGVPVLFQPSPLGTVTGGSAVTDQMGIATVGSWTIRSTNGVDTLRAFVSGFPTLIFEAVAGTFSPDITLHVDVWVPQGSTQLRAIIHASAPSGIASVQVKVADRTGNLVQDDPRSIWWRGVVELVGLPAGTYVAEVTATDNLGAISNAFKAFTYTPP